MVMKNLLMLSICHTLRLRILFFSPPRHKTDYIARIQVDSGEEHYLKLKHTLD